MKYYATPEEDHAFIERHVKRGTQLLMAPDLDGNRLIGYNLTKKGLELRHAMKEAHPLTEAQRHEALLLQLKPEDNAAAQDIPSGSNIAKLMELGLVEPAIFAKKPLDVRFSPEDVQMIDHLIKIGASYSQVPVTSRAGEDVHYILRESGIAEPKKASFVSNSGNRVTIDGVETIVRPLNHSEQTFIDGVAGLCAHLEAPVRELLRQAGHLKEAESNQPLLRAEPKGDAFNIHYRELLETAKPPINEESALGVAIAKCIETEMQRYVNDPSAPLEHNARGQLILTPSGEPMPVFKLGAGPMTFEVKLANVTKAQGLHEIIGRSDAAGKRPEVVMFTGDDYYNLLKGEKTTREIPKAHGTDWFAGMYVAGHPMPGVGGTTIGLPEGIVGLAGLTHHPEGEDRTSFTPATKKAIPQDSPLLPDGIKIVHRLPEENSRFNNAMLRHALGLELEALGAPTHHIQEPIHLTADRAPQR